MSAGSTSDFAPVRLVIDRGGQPFPIAAWTNDPGARPADIVWLHANGLNALTYRTILAGLPRELKVLAVDQRGHGRTPQAAPAANRRDALDLRDDLLALLEVVAVDSRVILAGHSLGGCVSLLAAAEAPARVRGLALFDPVILSRVDAERAIAAGDGSVLSEAPLVQKARARRRAYASREEAFRSYFGRAIFQTWPEQAVRDYVEAGFRDLPGQGVELACAPEWEAAIFAGHGHDIWGAMARIEAPVRIYRAEQGSTCAIDDPAQFPRPQGQVRVETVAGSTHFLPIERADVVRDALADLARAAPR